MGKQSNLRAYRRHMRQSLRRFDPEARSRIEALTRPPVERSIRRSAALALGAELASVARYAPRRGEERVTLYRLAPAALHRKNSRGPVSMAAEGAAARRTRLEAERAHARAELAEPLAAHSIAPFLAGLRK